MVRTKFGTRGYAVPPIDVSLAGAAGGYAPLHEPRVSMGYLRALQALGDRTNCMDMRSVFGFIPEHFEGISRVILRMDAPHGSQRTMVAGFENGCVRLRMNESAPFQPKGPAVGFAGFPLRIQSSPGVEPAIGMMYVECDSDTFALKNSLEYDPSGAQTEAQDVLRRFSNVVAATSMGMLDGRTGLVRQELIRLHLQQCVNEFATNNTGFAIILLDIDYFGQFNKKHGLQVGDTVLQTVGETIYRVIRTRKNEMDMAGRYGGDEMIVVLQNASAADAWRVAERLRKEIAVATVAVGDSIKLGITCSVGVADAVSVLLHAAGVEISAHQLGEHGERVIERADGYLRGAKQDGRNRVGCELRAEA